MNFLYQKNIWCSSERKGEKKEKDCKFSWVTPIGHFLVVRILSRSSMVAILLSPFSEHGVLINPLTDNFLLDFLYLHFTFNIHISSIKKEHKCVPIDKICTHCIMNKQYVKEVQKQIKAHLRLMDDKMNKEEMISELFKQ